MWLVWFVLLVAMFMYGPVVIAAAVLTGIIVVLYWVPYEILGKRWGVKDFDEWSWPAVAAAAASLILTTALLLLVALIYWLLNPHLTST